MKKIKQNSIIPSAAFSIPKTAIKQYREIGDQPPKMGDLVYGEVTQLGFHTTLESESARLHSIHDRTAAVFVFGNRYAPDHFEGFVPARIGDTVDMLARSGVIGEMKCHNERISSPTKIRVLGYVCDNTGKVINTKDHILIRPKTTDRSNQGAKIILCIGTSMNCGKSHAAAACCYALSSMGKKVRAAKITGTASQKDILLMEDCGAQHIADFTHFGFPSTYMLEMDELMSIFNGIDMKYGNNPRNYLVLEFADGIFQRETAMLLQHEAVMSRVHKLLFCASDSAGVAGGLKVLKETFGLDPHAVSGVCSSSPLSIREIKSFTDIPILKSLERDYKGIYSIIR